MRIAQLPEHNSFLHCIKTSQDYLGILQTQIRFHDLQRSAHKSYTNDKSYQTEPSGT